MGRNLHNGEFHLILNHFRKKPLQIQGSRGSITGGFSLAQEMMDGSNQSGSVKASLRME